MNVEYHAWRSPRLGQEMALKVYGHAGWPVLVFPAQSGRFYDYENFGMINAASWFIEEGKFQFYCVDSVDSQSWANWDAHPADRAARHQSYDGYICEEVLPFVRQRNGPDARMIATGVSMGGYHSGNFFFRHPDLFNGLISMSGLFQLSMFIGDFVNEDVFYNCPLLYLPNLNDDWYLDQYRQSKIIICAGQGAWEDAMLADIRPMQAILEQKGIPAWVDYWGHNVNHDWPWWLKQLPYFLSKLS